MFQLPGESYKGPLPEPTRRQAAWRQELERDVRALSDDIGERNVMVPEAYRRARDWIEHRFRELGYEPARQEFEAGGMICTNIEAELAGTESEAPPLIVAAHYDTVPHSPGANDNATAVAALLGIAGSLKERGGLRRSIRFLCPANEEPPFFQSDQMGSMVYADRCRQRGESLLGAIALDGLGCYFDEPHTQKYPMPVGWVYPSEGNFIAMISNFDSADLLKQLISAFREAVAFPSEGATLPEGVTGAGFSDHWSFWQHGYPGVMVTDTLPFRDPRYHTPHDTADYVDFDRLSRVVDGLERAIAELAGR